MLNRIDLAALPAAKKAEMIYSQARSEMSDRLWRAALGTGGEEPRSAGGRSEGMSFDALLTLLDVKSGAATPPPPSPRQPPAAITPEIEPAPVTAQPQSTPPPIAAPTRADGLGPNARHMPALSAAAARTGIPVPALAAIVHAEAAKARDGSWIATSRNPRSSAAGLGQFLSGTWQGMAEIKGTWLNDVARTRGWLGDGGKLLSGARSALLALRFDPAASINTTADYARHNLDGLRRAGVSIGSGASTIAQSAYLGHHLGLRDAVRFMQGGLDPARAKMLLGAQVGVARASEHIAAAGNATAAHRTWFMNYVSRNVRPEKFVG